MNWRVWERVRAGRPTEDELLAPEPRRFRVGEREIVVKPLVIGDFRRISGELAALAQRVAREHPDLDFSKPDEHLQTLLPLCQDLLGMLFEKLFGIDAEYVEEHLTLAQATEILVAFLELNQLPVIRGNVLRALLLGKALVGVGALSQESGPAPTMS